MDQNWNTDRSKCTPKYSSAPNENFNLALTTLCKCCRTVLAINPPGVFHHQGF